MTIIYKNKITLKWKNRKKKIKKIKTTFLESAQVFFGRRGVRRERVGHKGKKKKTQASSEQKRTITQKNH
ncbi:hypothetical protein, partial [Neisseria gonorrhoeae]|uniref:hypothetical protein n=1 Tax=Neisseria gonorrhoeae TaxID=485 RepID=UPI001C614888